MRRLPDPFRVKVDWNVGLLFTIITSLVKSSNCEQRMHWNAEDNIRSRKVALILSKSYRANSMLASATCEPFIKDSPLLPHSGSSVHRYFRSPHNPQKPDMPSRDHLLLYPNGTECIRLISAGEGERILLDFTEVFNIEISEKCYYDFIEIRDGPFGYSPLIGRYCGRNAPSPIRSTGRFLWLRFHSDESIEYSGFRALYSFFSERFYVDSRRVVKPVCQLPVSFYKDEGMISSEDIPIKVIDHSNRTHKVNADGSIAVLSPIDCTWILYVPTGQRIYLKWLSYEMTTPQTCADSYLELYEGSTSEAGRRKSFCGSLARDIQSNGNYIYLRMVAISPLLLPKFETLASTFQNGPCSSGMFNCGDNTCVNRTLVCNGRHNCNYSWDELSCKKKEGTSRKSNEPIPFHLIVLAVIAAFVATVLTIALVCSRRQMNEDEQAMAAVAAHRDNQHLKCVYHSAQDVDCIPMNRFSDAAFIELTADNGQYAEGHRTPTGSTRSRGSLGRQYHQQQAQQQPQTSQYHQQNTPHQQHKPPPSENSYSSLNGSPRSLRRSQSPANAIPGCSPAPPPSILRQQQQPVFGPPTRPGILVRGGDNSRSSERPPESTHATLQKNTPTVHHASTPASQNTPTQCQPTASTMNTGDSIGDRGRRRGQFSCSTSIV